jgi:hypothetical protein
VTSNGKIMSMIRGKACIRLLSWPVSRYYASMQLDVLGKITKNLGQGSQYPGQKSQLGASHHEADVLTVEIPCFVIWNPGTC